MNENNISSPVSKACYRTSDIYFSAFLCSVGYPMTTTEATQAPDGGKKIVFVFSIPEIELPKIKAAYFGGSGTVKARTFVDNLRSLKSLCFT